MEGILSWGGWAVAAVGLLRTIFGDRLKVEKQITSTAAKVEDIKQDVKDIKTSVQAIADQNVRLGAVEKDVSEIKERVGALEGRV